MKTFCYKYKDKIHFNLYWETITDNVGFAQECWRGFVIRASTPAGACEYCGFAQECWRGFVIRASTYLLRIYYPFK
jgi:hypothetical protein